jgi:hypothetical protein
LKIRAIGGVGCTKAQRDERRQPTNTANRKAKRAADRALRPAKVIASESKPWLALGLGRSSYYAMLKRQASELGQNLSAVSCPVLTTDNICPNGPMGASPQGDLTRSAVAGGLVLNPAITAAFLSELSAAADLALYPAIETVETKRDSTVVGRLGRNWIQERQESLRSSTFGDS